MFRPIGDGELFPWRFKRKVTEYIKEMLPWRVHHKKGVMVTAGSTQLALQNIFNTLHIGMFFPKVDEKIDRNLGNNELLGFVLDGGYDMTG